MTAASQPQLSCWGLIKSPSSGGVVGYWGSPSPLCQRGDYLLANLTLLAAKSELVDEFLLAARSV